MHTTKKLGAALAVSLLITRAACAALNLPPNADAVTFTAAAGTSSTLTVTFTGIPAGHDLSNVTYAAWVIGQDPQIPNPNETHIGALNTSSSLVPLDVLNYVLANKTGTPQDVQAAITYLAFYPAVPLPSSQVAVDMINDAQANGPGFVPGPTDPTAVLLEWAAPSENATIIEVPPALVEGVDRFTAGGFIMNNGSKCNFGIQGGMLNGKFWGGLNYIDQTTGVKVRSRSCTSYFITGPTCRRATYDVTINGAAGTATVIVCDNGEPGRNDSVQITLSNGYTASGTLSKGGNVQLHKPKPAKK